MVYNHIIYLLSVDNIICTYLSETFFMNLGTFSFYLQIYLARSYIKLKFKENDIVFY